MVLLIGNYVPDRQQSMLRFNRMMLDGLQAAGIAVELVRPEAFFGKLGGGFLGKWLAYLDKYILFPRKLRARLRLVRPALVHILDHSNAVYVEKAKPFPTVVTVHDVLAIRGALGEETDCPASPTGKFLQHWILIGLQQADALVCVSQATRADAEKLLKGKTPQPRISIATLGLNYPYRKLPMEEARRRLVSFDRLDSSKPFVLHVGSALKRKNRDGVLRIFARTKEQWNGQLVFAGDPMTPEMHSLGKELGILERVVEVIRPDSSVLEGLYNLATALIFPSRYEGFGWPIAEAQACGCPVICSEHPPMSEAAGGASLLHGVDDEEAFARDIIRLTNASEHAQWSEKGLRAATRFASEKMIAQYVDVYRTLVAQL